MQLKPKEKDFFEELNNISSEDMRNPFIIKGFENKAKKMLKTDPAEAYLLLGAISAIKMDTNLMHSHYQNAIKLNPECPRSYIHYAVSLNRLGFYGETFNYANLAYEIDPGNMESLDVLIISVLNLGKISQTFDLIRKWEINCQQTHYLSPVVKEIMRLMGENNITDKDIYQTHQSATKLIRKQNLYINKLLYTIISQQGFEWILCEYYLNNLRWNDYVKTEEEYRLQIITLPDRVKNIFKIDFATNDTKINLEKVKRLIEKGCVSDARRILSTIQASSGYSEKTDNWRKVLAEPRTVKGEKATGGGLKQDSLWLRKYSSEYKGKWVALDNGVLLGSHASRIQLRHGLKKDGKLNGAMFFRITNNDEQEKIIQAD